MCYIRVSLFFTTFALHVRGRDPALRIIGGSDADDEAHAYIARIQLHLTMPTLAEYGIALSHFEHLCSCAILTPFWTLTAGHCVQENITDSYVNEKIGEVKFEYIMIYGPIKKTTTAKILQWMRHPAYKRSIADLLFYVYNDIGLIKTEEVHLRLYGHISAMDYATLIGHEAIATGHGKMNISGIISSATSMGKPLQKLEVLMVKCSSAYEHVRPKLCISRRCDKQSHVCPGDSGGPLLHSSGIVGVNTAAPTIACHPLNNVWFSEVGGITPVSPYVDWITHTINKDV
ncbi:hypothetical protein HF086_004424 [Spodoptera exigua]|uniref:Peptidase S1 domain-containing protein n=1 Tax=Spodoptera exigua TaxID=7107 RepID=A0A922MEQ4_SPOEX|nr:hypothetical protein HF086_004424 [Spodoptera exigua]